MIKFSFVSKSSIFLSANLSKYWPWLYFFSRKSVSNGVAAKEEEKEKKDEKKAGGRKKEETSAASAAPVRHSTRQTRQASS